MRVDGCDGQTYLTATAIRDEDGYADVGGPLLRAWVLAGHLRVVTRGELAAAFRLPAPPAGLVDAPARTTGPSGWENVYRWADVVRAETRTRHRRKAHGGRPRTVR